MKRTFFREFVLLIRVILTPGIWMQNHRYSSTWDAKIQSLMAENMFKDNDRYTAKLDGREIWIANYPYAAFNPYGWGVKVRPSRRTIIAAWDKLCEDSLTDHVD